MVEWYLPGFVGEDQVFAREESILFICEDFLYGFFGIYGIVHHAKMFPVQFFA